MSDPMTWGPWIGVPKDRQSLCAVDGCTERGRPQHCPYDGQYHHHGCIHYDCDVAQKTGHGLTFREGWGWLCRPHTLILYDALHHYRNPDAREHALDITAQALRLLDD